MRKINWKESDEYANARIGGINLYCSQQYPTSNKFQLFGHHMTFYKRKRRWSATVSTSEHKGYYAAEVRKGPIRYSSSKAKEDAIRLARELLLDHQAALDIEKKNFDM